MKTLKILVTALAAICMLANAEPDRSKTEKDDGNKVESSTGTPNIITRPLISNTGEYAKTPCYKTERYCPETLPDGKCKLWDTKQVEVSC